MVTSGTNVQTTTYEYVDGGYGTNSTTPLVKSITQPGICFDYAYDNRGNIISEKRYAPGTAEANKLETTYVYDGLGQLIRVNDPHENATWVYSYDRGGNILSKTKYAFTTGALGSVVEDIPYTYGDSNWKDKLTAYNGVGITYDEIGNPLFDGERTYTWGAGRQLRHISMPATGSNGSDGKTKEIDFIYDHNGMRTGKIVSENGKVEITEYTLHGKLITHLTKSVVDEEGNETTQELHFFYDAQFKPAFVEFEGVKYRYSYNLQGDVIAILDTAGTPVVEYVYDAWGNLIYNTVNELASVNPFCYRGYVRDAETNDAYLESRYYCLKWNRFLSCDKLLGKKTIIRHNVFTYCGNNPVMYCDPHGYSFISLLEEFKSKLESGITFILNKALYYLGKGYSIEQPKSGVVIRSKPKTIATGSSVKYFIDRDQWLRNLGSVLFEESYKVLDKARITFKLTVNIIQYGDAEPVANVTLQEGKSEGQSLGGFWELQDKFSQSYSVIERTDSNYVLFSGGNYYETTEAGTALIDELLAGITLTE